MRSLALLVTLSLAFAGCGGSSEPTIRLQLFGDTAEIAAYRTLIDAFERAHTGNVELVAVPNQGDHMAKLSTGFSGRNPPDLFLLNYRRFGQFAGRDVLEPLETHLDATLEASDFYPQALDAFRVDGTAMCLPQNISSLAVYYNKKIFERFGVPEPRPDWTWTDFLRTAKALTRDTDGDGNTDVYGVGTEPTFIRLSSFVWQAGGEVVDAVASPTRMTLLTDEAIEAVRFFIELRRVHRVAPSKEEAESEDYEDRFARGGLGMLLESRRTTALLRTVRDLEWDVAPLPRGRERATILHSDAYCMAKASKARGVALAFARFALGEEGAAIVARSGRTVPSIKSIATSEAFLDPTQLPKNAQVFLDNIPLVRRVPNIPTWHEIETKADVRVDEWYYGTEGPRQLGIEIDLDTRELFAGGQ